jgi:nucleotide-binding universal stress UspA family protein
MAMKVLIATDGSSYSDAAVRTAAERPWPPGSEFRILSVIERPAITYVAGGEYELDINYEQISADVRRSLEPMIAGAATQLSDKGFSVSQTIREGVAAEEILDEAREWGADLIMVGTHGRKGISRFLLGSVAQRVATHAPCSVEIVRAPS